MLLTKLIPPKSYAIKDAVSLFNRYIEEPPVRATNSPLWLILAGGRGSGKTTIAAGMCLKGLAEAGFSAIVMRKSMPDLRWMKQSFHQVLRILESKEDFLMNYNPMLVRPKCNQHRGHIMFCSADLGLPFIEKKCRGILNKKILWIEEASELGSQHELMKLVDVAVGGVSNPIVILTYNPPTKKSHWINQFASGRDGIDVFRPICTDLDVDMIGESLLRRAYEARIHNPNEYITQFCGIPLEN